MFNVLNLMKTGIQNAFTNKFGGLLDNPKKFMQAKAQDNPNANIGKLFTDPKNFVEYDLLGGMTKSPAEFQRHRMKKMLLAQGMTADQADQVLNSMPQK
tara:strand:- start:5830 stop:6126 length:297 start_codon:yes stop_codon:yes gene_type:complete